MACVWDEDRPMDWDFDEGAPSGLGGDGGEGGCAPEGPAPAGPGIEGPGLGGFGPQDGPRGPEGFHRRPHPESPCCSKPPRGVRPEPPHGPHPEPPRHGGPRPPRPAPEPLLYLDCQAGIAGDMLVAALLDLGGDEEALRAALASLPVDGYEVRVARVKKAGIDCCDFDVVLDAAHDGHDHDMAYLHGRAVDEGGAAGDAAAGDTAEEGAAPAAEAVGHGCGHEERAHEGHAGHTHGHRNLADIEDIINAAALTDGARALALRTFRILAEAEAEAHALPVDEVHFHEVGAVDSIVDIVAAAVLLDELGIRRVVVPALVDGHGTVRCQHGVIPVPAPATLNICIAHGLPLSQADVEGELVTPTGAALVAALEPAHELPARYVVEACGLGAGKREYAHPSVLRAMVIRPLEPPMGRPGPDGPRGPRPERPWGPRETWGPREPWGPHELWGPEEPWGPGEPWEARGPRPHGQGGPQGPCGPRGPHGPQGPYEPGGPHGPAPHGSHGPCGHGDPHGPGPDGPAPHGLHEPWGPRDWWDARPPRPEPPCGGPRPEPPHGNDPLEPPHHEPPHPEPPCAPDAPVPPRDPADRRICKLECDIDDCSPEQLAYAAERLRAAGAREVHWIPVFTKKGRPAYQLQVVCAERDAARLEEVAFLETTTIGIRRVAMERTVLPRSIEMVDTPWGPARVKRVELPDGRVRMTPEYEDCAAIAREQQLPLVQVMEAVRAAARREP